MMKMIIMRMKMRPFLCSSRVSSTSAGKDSSEVNRIIIVIIFIIVTTNIGIIIVNVIIIFIIVIIFVIIIVLISMITSGVAPMDFPSSVPPSLMVPASTQIWSGGKI